MGEKQTGIWEDESFLAICNPKVAGIYDYWKAKRGERPMPARRDLDPIELKPYLGSIILYDVLREPLDFRYRLVGTHIALAMGRDLTGCRLSDVSATEDQAYAMTALSDIVRRRVYRFRNDPLRGERGSFLGRDRIHLPLSEDGVEVTMLLLYFGEIERLG
jgi:hypothetical protein